MGAHCDHQGPRMGALTEMATMQITTWTRATGSTYGSLSRDLEASVLGEHAEEFDIEAIERDWREAIDEALPEGIFLAGDEFYGPTDSTVTAEDIAAAVDSVDVWPIVERHAK